MTIQMIELAGQKFVILPEPEFRELERRLSEKASTAFRESKSVGSPFEPVIPFDISGESASEMLIRERR